MINAVDNCLSCSSGKREDVCNELRKARLILGRALIKAYSEKWIPRKLEVDRIIEEIVLSGKWLKFDIVQGGSPVPPQEMLMILKENSPQYRGLTRNITRMEGIIRNLSEEKRFLLEEFYWRGVPWYEVAEVLCLSRTTFHRKKYEIEEYIGREWGNPIEG